jgi:hypothetical protein
VTPRRHIIRIELSRVGSTAATWGFRQAVYRGMVQMEGIGADGDARRRRDRAGRPRPHPGLVTQRAKDEPDEGVPDERVLPTRQAETRPQTTGYCVLVRMPPGCEHQRRSRRAGFVGQDERPALHYLTTSGAQDKQLG